MAEASPGQVAEVAAVVTLAAAATGYAAVKGLDALQDKGSSSRSAVHPEPARSNVLSSFKIPEALRRRSVMEKKKRELYDWAHQELPGLHSLVLVASYSISVGLYGYDTYTDWDLFLTVAGVSTCDLASFAPFNESLSDASQRCFAVENATVPCARHYWNVVENPANASTAGFQAWKLGACSGYM